MSIEFQAFAALKSFYVKQAKALITQSVSNKHELSKLKFNFIKFNSAFFSLLSQQVASIVNKALGRFFTIWKCQTSRKHFSVGRFWTYEK